MRDLLAMPPTPADQRVPYGDDRSQFLDLFLTRGKTRGTAAFIHGGFWRAKYDLTHASHVSAGLARAGIATASLEYRRSGNGGGWPATFDDLKRALTVARQHLPSDPVVLGHSAGGHLALRLASESKVEVKGAIGLAPCADLQMAYDLHLSNDAVVEFLGGTPAAARAKYADADARLHASKLPRILIHGTADDVVPIALSRSFMGARGNDTPKPELIELAGVDHFALIDPEADAFKTVLSSVERLLR